MSNVVNVADILQRLNDQQLQGELKNPSGQVPQFLVVGEMQRRQKMRAGGQQKPASTTTVLQDTLQAQQPQGVAGLPQMASGEDAPGGVASFAGGGLASDYVPYEAYGADGGPITDDTGETFSGISDYLKRANARFKHEFNKARGVMTDPLDTNTKPEEASYAEYVKADPPQVAGLKKPPEMKPMVEPKPNAAGIATLGPNPFASAPPPAPEEEAPFSSGASGAVGSGSSGGGIASLRNAGMSNAPAPSAPRPPVESELAVGNSAMPERIEPPAMKDARDYLEMVKAENPDMIAPVLEEARSRLADNAKGKDQAFNMALLQAGLGMMASKNTSFLGAVGEGGIGGVKVLGDQMHEVRRREDDLRGNISKLSMAQQEAARGNFKTAADMANARNTRETSMYGYQVAERRDDLNSAKEDKRVAAALKRDDRRNDLEERKLQSIDNYRGAQIGVRQQANAIRAKGGSGKGGGKGTDKEAKTALAEFNKRTSEELRAGSAAAKADPLGLSGAKPMTPEEARRKAYDAMAPSQRKHIAAMYGIGAAPVAPAGPQKKRLVMDASGNIVSQ